MCITGHSNLCDLGAATFLPARSPMDRAVPPRRALPQRDVQAGTFAEHSVCHEASLVKVDSDLPLTAVALVSCGVATAGGRRSTGRGHAGRHRGGGRVGGVGINAVQGAKMVGARNIVAVDRWSSSRSRPSTSGPPTPPDPWARPYPWSGADPGPDGRCRDHGAGGDVRGPHGRAPGPDRQERNVRGHRGGPQVQTEASVNLFDLAMMQKEIKGSSRCGQSALRHPQPLGPVPVRQLKLDELITRTYHWTRSTRATGTCSTA